MVKRGGKGAGTKKKKGGNGKQNPQRDGAEQSLKQPTLPTIRQQLASLDPPCTIHDVEADGNCLFRSLHDQLKGVVTLADHGDLRGQLVDHIAANAAFYSMFVEDDEEIDAYIRRMREEGSWGGHIELHACVMKFGVNVSVFQDRSPVWRIMEWPDDTMMVSVTYHDGNHYNSVHTKGGVPASMVGGRSPAAEVDGNHNDNREGAETCTSGAGPDTKDTHNTDSALKKGQCPCGSGKKYRKCCKKRQKRIEDPVGGSVNEVDKLTIAVENIDI